MLLLSMTSFVVAGEKMSDAEIKQKVICYWHGGHHGWHIAADGIMYICPGTSKSHWSVKDGKFNGGEIVTLTDKKFVYRDSRDGTAYTMIRGTKEEIAPCGGSQ